MGPRQDYGIVVATSIGDVLGHGEDQEKVVRSVLPSTESWQFPIGY